jgi:hypothetical protein
MIAARLLRILTSKPVRIFIYLALATYGFTVLRGIVVKDKQWDFRTYYYAAQVHASGGNPYDTDSLSRAAGEEIEFPYVYPPVTLYAFRPFLAFGFPAAYLIFLILKLAALGLLVWLWIRFLRPERGYGLLLFVFCFLAFRKTLVRDLNAGNISCFEQVLVWLAAFCLLAGRQVSFSILIAGSAIFKLTSGALLGLALIDRTRKSLVSTVAVAVGLVLVNVASYLNDPTLYRGFLANALALDERGKVNPSSLAFIRDAISSVGGGLPARLGGIDYGVYLVVLACLALCTLAVARRVDLRAERRDFLIFCCFVYALAAPRFKDYSYMLLVVPAIYVIREAVSTFLGKALASALVCVYLFTYQPLLAAAVLWVVMLRHLVARRPGPHSCNFGEVPIHGETR